MNIKETRYDHAHYNVICKKTMNGFVHVVLRKITNSFKRTVLLWALNEIFHKLSIRYKLGTKIERKINVL